MKHLGTALTVTLLAWLPSWTRATPSSGHDCAGCHGSVAADKYNDSRLTLLNTEGTANPVERAGATDRGTLPVYQVLPNTHQILSISTTGLPSGNKSGVLTNNFQKPGVVSGNTLSFTPDPAWVTRSGSGNTWYTRASFSSGTSYSYDITVPANAVPDFYEFELGWGGDGGNDGGFKRFYLQVLSAIANAQWNINNNGNWSVPGNWSGGVPNAIDATANFGTIITSSRTVTVDGPQTVGSINFSSPISYTVSGPGTLTLDASSAAIITVAAGAHTIGAPLVLNKNLTVSTADATGLEITANLSAAGRSITKAGLGTAQFENVRASSLNVQAGVARISAKGAANSAAGTSVVGALSIAAGAQVDLTNNSMIIDYVTAGTLVGDTRQQLLDGRLTSTSADATRRVGYADNSTVGATSFAGQTVDATSLLVKYTYAGDTNLDGQVDITDLGNLATAWQTSGVWTAGDSDYSGFIDITDLGMLATNWQAGVGSPLGPDSLTEALALLGLTGQLVPEPAAAIFALLGGAMARRRRH